MNTAGEITIKVQKVDGGLLTPDNYDIFDLPQVIENVKDMLFPNGRNKTSPLVTYEMREGCVTHVFKTQLQKVLEFGSIIMFINAAGTLNGLDTPTAQAFENIQDISRKQGLSFGFSTSEYKEKTVVLITPSTNLSRAERIWAEAEFYFYGKLIDAGGKDNAFIHLDTEEYGRLRLSADKDYLRDDIKGNPLYRYFAVRAKGRQDVATGEIDLKNLHLVEITDYQREFDEEYIDGLIRKATPHWKDVDVDAFLLEVRGGAYA